MIKSFFAYGIIFFLVLFQTRTVNSQQPRRGCPLNLDSLTEQLLMDLPAYANRVIQRARLSNDPYEDSYIILAGKADDRPLPLKNQQYQPIFPDSTQQFFFTTLERHYHPRRAVTFRSYHWVFLTKTEQEWQLVKVISLLASLNEEDVPLPPVDTTQGVIGQSIRLWLRDCQVIK